MSTLQEYRCHKTVKAMRIVSIEPSADCGFVLIGEDTGVAVTHEYIAKHNPVPGGYFVQYNDGYQSFSPAAAFEEGYSLVSTDGGDNSLGDFSAGQWWVKELEAMVSNGAPDQKRAVSVLHNLLRVIAEYPLPTKEYKFPPGALHNDGEPAPPFEDPIPAIAFADMLAEEVSDTGAVSSTFSIGLGDEQWVVTATRVGCGECGGGV